VMHLRDLTVAPPGSWSFKDPTTGIRISATTYNDLVRNVQQFRRNNGITWEGSLGAEIQQQICGRLNAVDQVANCSGGLIPPTHRSVGAKDVMRFLSVMGSWVSSGGGFVEQEEAERRAAICAGCSFNVEAAGCSVCQDIAGNVAKVLGGRSTPHDAQLKNCGICGCEGKSSVHMPLDTLKAGSSGYEYPTWCWRRTR